MLEFGDEEVQFSHVVIMGDSLSDRGYMAQKRETVAALSGLKGRSPLGRFTDGLVWGDYLADEMVAERRASLRQQRQALILAIDNLKDNGVEQNQQEILLKEEQLAALEQELDNGQWRANKAHHKHIRYRGERFMRSYAEGGLTSSEYNPLEGPNVGAMGARMMVANLREKRERLIEDDKKYDVTPEQKRQTLIVEWSGANDIATVNTIENQSIFEDIDKAIEARIENIEKLIEKGYTQFVLFNLPDLSVVPRFHGTELEERAGEVGRYYNEKLAQRILELKDELDFDEVNIQLYDTNPALKESITSSMHKKQDVWRLSPQKGLLKQGELNTFFYDDVHPSQRIHEFIGKRFFNQMRTHLNLEQHPKAANELYQHFRHAFDYALSQQSPKSKFEQEEAFIKRLDELSPEQAFIELFKYAQSKNDDNLIHKVMQRVEFFDSKVHPVLLYARQAVLYANNLEKEAHDAYIKEANIEIIDLLLERLEAIEQSSGSPRAKDKEYAINQILEYIFNKNEYDNGEQLINLKSIERELMLSVPHEHKVSFMNGISEDSGSKAKGLLFFRKRESKYKTMSDEIEKIHEQAELGLSKGEHLAQLQKHRASAKAGIS